MSYSTMIAAASVTPGQPGSLFKIPCADSLGDLYVARSSLDFLGDAVKSVDGTFDPTFFIDKMDTTINLLNNHLTEKIANTPSHLAACVAASSVVYKAQLIDSAVAGADYPNVIGHAFPSKVISSDSIVTSGFVSITECVPQVATCLNQVNASFNGSGSGMNGVYSSIQSAGGPYISNGADLLVYFSGATDQVRISVTNQITVDTGAQDSIKNAFAVCGDAFDTLNAAFTDSVLRETSSMAFAMNQLSGNATVSMLNSKSPDVASVLAHCIDYAQVSATALAVAQKVNAAPIPGTPAVTSLKTNRPITEANSPAVLPSPGPDVKYGDSEIAAMSQRVTLQSETVNGVQLELVNWLKVNIEDWKPAVDYDSKRLAAGYSPEQPDGTTTNATIKAIWVSVRDQLTSRMYYYNNTLLPRLETTQLVLKQMKQERERRMYFGRNPYSFLASRGESIPSSEQTVYFDSTR